jgi:parallel beta-helix repeat protein
MKRMMIVFLLAAAALHAQGAFAETYHVSPSGSDSNDGSAGSPWLTLQHAADSVGAGDEVVVEPGTYTGFYIETGGSVDAPLVFRAASGGVIVNSRNSETPDNINVEGADYVVIEGFTVTDAERTGIRVVEARGVVVRSCTIGPSGVWGILTGFAVELRLIGNVTFGSGEQHGIYVSNSHDANDNPVVAGNESYGNAMNGIQFNGDCFMEGDGVISGAVIEGNYVHDNGMKGFSLISLSDSVIRNNLIVNNGIEAGAGGIHLVDEPDCGLPSSRNVVVNNTIAEPRIAAIRANLGAEANVIFNNLIISTRGEPIADEDGLSLIDDATNLVFAEATTDIFVDPAAPDYHLIGTSPAVNAGAASFSGAGAPADDFDGLPRPDDGGGFDVGCYEFWAAPPPLDDDGEPLPEPADVTEPVDAAGDDASIPDAAGDGPSDTGLEGDAADAAADLQDEGDEGGEDSGCGCALAR